jgi:hypothetical protein
MLTLAEIQTEAYATAHSKGWHDKPLRSVIIGATLGSPEPGSPALVVAIGEHVGRFCDLPTAYGETMKLPGHIFGRLIDSCQSEVWTIDHDRVLRAQALMHTELTEADSALEDDDVGMRIDDETGKPEGFVVEIADLVVRVCNTTKALGLVLDQRRSDVTWLDRASGQRPAVEIRHQRAGIDRELTARLWLGRVRRHVDAASEAVRVDAWDTYVDELLLAVLTAASIVIGLGYDLNAAIEAKMRYNSTSAHRHGGKQA